jgi:hypothetical protein
MPDTMATFTRTQVTAGRSTIMEAGTLQISPSLTGKGQKVASNGQRARVISSARRQRVARIEQPAGAAPTVQGEAVSIVPGVEADPVIWTARLRTGHVVIFQASAPRIFNAAASIAAVAVVDLAAAATDSVVAVGLAAGALGALVGSAAVAVDSGVGDNN